MSRQVASPVIGQASITVVGVRWGFSSEGRRRGYPTGGNVRCLRSNVLEQTNCRPRFATPRTLGVLGHEDVVQYPEVVLGGEVHHGVEHDAEAHRESARWA